MATINENINQLVKTEAELREIISLCYAPVADNEGLTSYPEKLARLAVDEPTPEVIGVAPRVTAGGRVISDSISSVRSIYGETRKFNQLFDANAMAKNQNCSYSNGVFTVTADRDWGGASYSFAKNPLFAFGNKYFIAITARVLSGEGSVYFGENELGNVYFKPGDSFVLSARISSVTKEFVYTQLNLTSDKASTIFEAKIPIIVNLTAIYGEGKEPTSVDAFCQDYFDKNAADVTDDEWAMLAEYKEPTLVNSSPKSIVSKSRNLSDEEFELGEIRSEDGLNSASTSNIRTKNYIKVKPNTKYYFCCEPLLAASPRARFYDENKNYIGYSCKESVYVPSNRAFTTPDNAHYVRFAFPVTNYGSNTYRNDICFNESDSDDGKYTPYFESTLEIDPKVIRDENGEQVFPEGLLSAGKVRDEIDWERGVAIKRVADADLGSLDWTRGSNVFYTRSIIPISNNLICDKYEVSSSTNSASMPEQSVAADVPNNRFFFKKSDLQTNDEIKDFLAGSYIHYEISPIEYPLPASWRKSWMRVANGGTERITADGMTLPLHADIAYRTANAAALANDLSNANNLL